MRMLAFLLVVVVAGSAGAQTKPTASAAGTAGAKQRLQSQHYGQVQNLRRGPDGQWTGKATRNGVTRNVTVSPNGTVTAR